MSATVEPSWSLAGVARHVLEDEDELFRLRSFLHEFGLAWQDADTADRPALVAEEPPPLGMRWDPFVAALAEYLCWHSGLEAPAWTRQPHRYLRTYWFPGTANIATLRHEALVHAPAHFEAHGVFLARRELEVV